MIRNGAARRPKTDADRKALKLLRMYLTPAQRRSFNKRGWFIVRGSKSRKSYRIRYGSDYVVQLGGNKVLLGLHLLKRWDWVNLLFFAYPDADQSLAQKLLLETNEPAAWRMACQVGGNKSLLRNE